MQYDVINKANLPGYECHDHDQIAQGEYKPDNNKDLVDHKPAAKFAWLSRNGKYSQVFDSLSCCDIHLAGTKGGHKITKANCRCRHIAVVKGYRIWPILEIGKHPGRQQQKQSYARNKRYNHGRNQAQLRRHIVIVRGHFVLLVPSIDGHKLDRDADNS